MLSWSKFEKWPGLDLREQTGKGQFDHLNSRQKGGDEDRSENQVHGSDSMGCGLMFYPRAGAGGSAGSSR